MVLKVWNNLLKFMFMRWSIQLVEALQSAYALCVRVLRKLNRRVIRFSWLQRAINRLLPCPQMVARYIDPALGVEKFFSILNDRRVRYTVLRWFENFPVLTKDDDVDMLVHDDDLPKIKDLFVTLPTGISCDIYAVSPLHGASYRKGISLYPSQLARQILDTSILYKDTYRVPDTKHYFLSLAYHAVYHKAETSGLAYAKDKCVAAVDEQRPYAEKLVALGNTCGFNVSPDLQSLHALLTECGWAPRIDILRALAKDSGWLTSLLSETLGGKVVSSATIRYSLNVHGVRMLVESDCPIFMEYFWRDFSYFQNDSAGFAGPHIRLRFLNQEPPWKEIPRPAAPLLKTEGSIVHKQGPNRYVDHDGEVLAIYNLKRDEGTVYSLDPDAMYRIAYSLIMTRVGFLLDRAGYHRIEALGVSLEDAAFLFLARGGCGKTTLGFELMKNPQMGWLTDDIVILDAQAKALAFPTSPKLIVGSVVPWLPSSVTLERAPMPLEPPKVQIPSSAMLPRVRGSARIARLFLCRRNPGVGPSIKRLGFVDALRGVCQNGFDDGAFGKRLAYHFQFSPIFVLKMAAVYFSRLRTFISIVWKVPVFRYDLGDRISQNATLVLDMYAAMSGDETGVAVHNYSDVPASGPQGALREQTGPTTQG